MSRNFHSNCHEKRINEYQGVTYALRADNLSTSEISSVFDLKPTHAFERGDIFIPKHGSFAGKEVTHQWGVWQYNSSHFVQSNEITDHIDFILESFEKKNEEVHHYLNDVTFDIQLRIWFEGGSGIAGIGFDNTLLLRMMSICKAIFFTIARDEYSFDESIIKHLIYSNPPMP